MTLPGGVGARLVCQVDRHKARLQHQGLAVAPLSRRHHTPEGAWPSSGSAVAADLQCYCRAMFVNRDRCS